jgi:non-ribosomal peptide synthetase component F
VWTRPGSQLCLGFFFFASLAALHIHLMLCIKKTTNKRLIDDQTLHGLIARQVLKTPVATAVEIPGGVCLTYSQLFCAAQEVAGRLRTYGVSRGAIVGTAIESLAMLITHLGILLAGGNSWLLAFLCVSIVDASSLLIFSTEWKYMQLPLRHFRGTLVWNETHACAVAP